MKSLLPLTIISLFLLSIIPTAYAQPSGIKTGDRVRLQVPKKGHTELVSYHKIVGAIISISSDSIEIKTGKRINKISLLSLKRLEISKGKRRTVLRGLAIGTVLGTGVGAIAGGSSECRGCSRESKQEAVSFTASLGAMAGGFIGLAFGLIKKEKWQKVPIDITMDRIQPRFKDSTSKPMITVKWSFGKKKR
ncbi:MAG: hypothetical protein R3211_05715 [Balneolaceae bacterium]|nr:hypothetical protein [Balneolaceae bacterium]